MEILFQDPLKFKAVGLDKISARLLKDSVDVITPSLTNLQIIVNLNKMLETLIFQRFVNFAPFTRDYSLSNSLSISKLD